MLKIHDAVLEQVRNTFLSHNNIEQGFLLGSRHNLEQIDICSPISANQASTYFISPDAEQADRIISYWTKQNICFCGMMHSHVRKKEDLSEADISFAKRLYYAYSLPFLWFGIGIVEPPDVRFEFYKLEQNHSLFSISQVEYGSILYRRK